MPVPSQLGGVQISGTGTIGSMAASDEVSRYGGVPNGIYALYVWGAVPEVA